MPADVNAPQENDDRHRCIIWNALAEPDRELGNIVAGSFFVLIGLLAFAVALVRRRGGARIPQQDDMTLIIITVV